MSHWDLVRVRSWAAVALGVTLALAVGCGIEDTPITGLRTPVETLLQERTFREGDVDVVEEVYLTQADQTQIFHLRAKLTNLGADLEGARYELVLQREIDVYQRVPSRLPTPTPTPIELSDPEVMATQELGTLFSGQVTSVSLSTREYGPTRLRASGRLVY